MWAMRRGVQCGGATTGGSETRPYKRKINSMGNWANVYGEQPSAEPPSC